MSLNPSSKRPHTAPDAKAQVARDVARAKALFMGVEAEAEPLGHSSIHAAVEAGPVADLAAEVGDGRVLRLSEPPDLLSAPRHVDLVSASNLREGVLRGELGAEGYLEEAFI